MALRDKYSADAVNKRMLNKQNNFSSFWLDDDWNKKNAGENFNKEQYIFYIQFFILSNMFSNDTLLL